MVSEAFVIVMVVQFLALFALLFVYASRYRKVPPDRAMVVYGRQMHPGVKIGYQVISGGGKFILPIIEDTKFMDLGLKEVVLDLDNLRTDPTKGASPVRVNIAVLYRISAEPSALHVACEYLLAKTSEDVKRMVEAVVQGCIRGIAAKMSPSDIDLNRDEVEEKLKASAWQDLLNMGIEIKALAIIRVHLKGGR